MILRPYVTVGLFLSLRVLADKAQQPISTLDTQTSDDCHNACTEMVTMLGGMASYEYVPDDFKESFFCARQSEIIPACVIRPLTPQNVSVAIQTISKHGCHFAIKSGGHAMFPGASNADGGITIDLKHLNCLEVSEDLATARVGTGNRWVAVYEVLEPLGLVAVRGRVGDVGVGGFLPAGGISFMGRRHGWGSDNVRNYEIVLANGSIANINYESHPDLFWALRGGGSNFGIVTRFDLEVYKQGPVWGGNNLFLLSDNRARYSSLNVQRPFSFSLTYFSQSLGRLGNALFCLLGRCTTPVACLQAFEEMIKKEKDDDSYLQFYVAFVYWPKWDVLAAIMLRVHSEPVANPPALKDLESLGSPIWTSDSVRNLTDIVRELSDHNTAGYRVLYSEITLQFNALIVSEILDIFIQEIETLINIRGLFPALVLQPISQISSVGNQKNGGNPFGFTKDDGPIVVLLPCVQWDDADDDEAVKTAIDRFMERTLSLTKETGVHHPWIYANYATKGQDVFAGVGEENRKRLKQIQKKYDPEGIFDRLQPGYFKV